MLCFGECVSPQRLLLFCQVTTSATCRSSASIKSSMSRGRTADVQVARPPAVGRHVDESPQFDPLRVVGEVFDGEVAVLIEIFQPALDRERVLADGKLQQNLARHGEMIVPEGDVLGLARLLLRRRTGASGRRRACRCPCRRPSTPTAPWRPKAGSIAEAQQHDGPTPQAHAIDMRATANRRNVASRGEPFGLADAGGRDRSVVSRPIHSSPEL